ncbi:MAG: gfo/Idh/MocA family oxidoreductase [Alphaproteobacteria bacterium]|nr:gfo/Idh/MocA family oxidoreductase [Alphaproteobacteria bacterium]
MGADRPIRVAAIGLGWVTRHRHIPALLRNPSFRLMGVIDRNGKAAQEVAARYNLHRVAITHDLGLVPWLDDIDAVTIGTAPFAHAEMACAALARGKHVLTEKPFAMNIAEGERMQETARAAGKTLAVMHNFQFSKAMRAYARDVARGRIGTVRRIAATQLGNPRRRLPSWYQDLPFGLFYDESPHFFYLLRKLAGGPLLLLHAHCLEASRGGATPAAAELVYRNHAGVPVTVSCNFESPVSEWFIGVYGENALALIDIFRDIYIRLPNDNTHAASNILRTSMAVGLQHWLQHIPNGLAYLTWRLDYGNNEVFARFGDAIHDGAEPAGIAAADGFEVLRMQHEAIEAMQKCCL